MAFKRQLAILFVAILSLTFGRPVSHSPARTGWWHPGSEPIAWQWELDHPLRLGNASDMGTSATLPDGKRAPVPRMYDVDLFINPASSVAALHKRGDEVVCYMEIGAAENYRPDYREFPKSVLGAKVPGYPAERYLDINAPVVRHIIERRIAMCAAKGFDGVEPDIDDSYTDDTGFHVTENQNIAYDRTLAAYAHTRHLAWGQKNGDNDPRFSRQLAKFADFLLDEQCFDYGSCGTVAPPYIEAKKPEFEVEYSLPRSRFCIRANKDDFNSQRMNVALAGGRQPCR